MSSSPKPPDEIPIEGDVIVASSGSPLYVRYCVPEGDIEGRIIISHGLSEHGGRYEHVMRALAQQGWASAAPDHLGHGRSSRVLALSPDMNVLARDLGAVRRSLLARVGQGPVVLWGHSMGGLVSILHLAQEQQAYAGAVLASTAALIPPRIPSALVRMGDWLGKVAPGLPVVPGNRSSYLTRDPERQSWTKADPLMYSGGIRAGTGAAILRGVRQIKDIAPTLRLPLLLTHGDKDKVMPVQSSRDLYAQVGAMDKTLRIYEGWVHELHNDLGREQYLNETIDWIRARLKGAQTAPTLATQDEGDRVEP